MFTRRSMIRALGFGAPAAAVAAAVGLPKPASGGYVLSTASHKIGEVGPEFHWPSASLTAFDVKTGNVTAGRITAAPLTISVKNLHPDAVVDFRDGVLRIGRAAA